MIRNETIEMVKLVWGAIKDIMLGFMGGAVAYMYDYSKNKKKGIEIRWSYGAMFINMFIGAFMSSTMGSFIPVDFVGRDGIIGFIGVSSYAIVGIIESKFADIILTKIGLNNNVEKNNKKDL